MYEYSALITLVGIIVTAYYTTQVEATQGMMCNYRVNLLRGMRPVSTKSFLD